jgi:hypothetical protein
MVEVIHTLRVTRSSAVKARTQTFNTLFGIMIGAPSPLRDELVVLTKRTLINRCLTLRPETTDFAQLNAHPERVLMASIAKASARAVATDPGAARSTASATTERNRVMFRLSTAMSAALARGQLTGSQPKSGSDRLRASASMPRWMLSCTSRYFCST